MDEFWIGHVADADEAALVRLAVIVASGQRLIRILEPMATDISPITEAGVHIILEALRPFRLIERRRATRSKHSAIQRAEVEFSHDNRLIYRPAR